MQKQRQFLKLGYVMALSLIVASLIYVACDTKKPTSAIESDGAIAVLNKSTSYTIETIKPELKKLLAYLNRNPQIITPAVLAKAAERHATINDLGLNGKFPTGFPLENGNTFEVYIELFNGSVGAGTSIEDTDAYFVLDIDRYPAEAEVADPDNLHDFVAYAAATEHNKRKGLFQSPESRRQLALDSTTQKVDYLLFFVGGEEYLSNANQARLYQQWLNSKPGIAKAQLSADTEYWWITKIKLDKKKDSSSEEFELYYGSTGYETDPFNYFALLLFNGTYQNDAY